VRGDLAGERPGVGSWFVTTAAVSLHLRHPFVDPAVSPARQKR
jgi:hypothetical protein